MTSNLEKSQGEGGCNDVAAWVSNTLSKSGHGGPERRDEVGKVGEEETPGANKCKLDQGKCDRLRIYVEDGFGGSVCEGGAHVPNDAK